MADNPLGPRCQSTPVRPRSSPLQCVCDLCPSSTWPWLTFCQQTRGDGEVLPLVSMLTIKSREPSQSPVSQGGPDAASPMVQWSVSGLCLFPPLDLSGLWWRPFTKMHSFWYLIHFFRIQRYLVWRGSPSLGFSAGRTCFGFGWCRLGCREPTQGVFVIVLKSAN